MQAFGVREPQDFNDAWFAGSSEGESHLRVSALRAIEARRDLVRAVQKARRDAGLDVSDRIVLSIAAGAKAMANSDLA